MGVCGIDRNAMPMRNMLLRNVMGTSTYTHHAYEAFRTLKATAEGKTPFTITDEKKLRWLAGQLNLANNETKEQVASVLADFLMAELSHSYDEPSPLIEIFAPPPRRKVWQDLAIYPAGVMHEIKDATASCLTNVDGDYFSLARKALRLGIAAIYGAQLPLEMVQDILFGTPMPHEVEVDLGIMDPDYVNIVFNGHEPWVGVATLLAAKSSEVQQRARAVGARGVRVIGSIESGQEVLQRFQQDDVFRGLTGNWLAIEPLLATGTVDVFAMDENCSPPSLAPYAEKYQVTLVAVSDLVRMPGVDKHLDYKPTEATYIATRLIEYGFDNFVKRRQRVVPHVPKKVQKAIAGFSPEAVLAALGGTLDPLVDVLKAGKIKGVVALVNCTTLGNGPHDYMTVNLAKELIKRDILIVSGGCGNHALEVGGLCNLDALGLAGPGLQEVCGALKIPPVLSFGTCTDTGRITLLVTALANHLQLDVPQLPIAVTAPEYMEQKATIDGLFALAYGTYTHLSPTPPVVGGPELVKLLTQDLEQLTGGKVALGDDPVEAAEGIEGHIRAKRAALGI
ncbi:MAG: anaerobic carbon-monoxide dehydrogenase catalytic subunit [Bacillota bacterium]|nr:anaerobic carbon-monoxide dehydrogenase catalytic subunit [Bacillota bacterium]MDK2855223.1 anaerobic carbon-monoxide dehydrogenase catalytic subunit [Bacillota bacterium]MDK2925744.1 anaerobic carbon-monoxide dehydrogenase catalytic subunit [Bacillota bacterium]